jgi:beta-lactamase class A
MGIIDAPGRSGSRYPYTFVGIIERPTRAKNYGAWIKRRGNAIRSVSDLVYRDMKQRHRLV